MFVGILFIQLIFWSANFLWPRVLPHLYLPTYPALPKFKSSHHQAGFNNII